MEFVLKSNLLTKRYKSQVAVNEVNMNIVSGDIYGFIGENGAGKTTIIRLITGLANVTSGSYELFGTNFESPDIYHQRKRVSAVVETPSLYLNMTAYDNLLMQCKVLGIKDTKIIDITLDIVGLGYLRNDKKVTKNFSLGMKQRLGIAVALIGDPDFIILDEPMNGLDPEGIVEIRELLLKLNKENKITFLISSHILGELSKIATKYGFIHKGKLIKELTAKELNDECQKCLELEIDNAESIVPLMKDLKINDYKIIENNIIRIYQNVEISSIITSLASNKVNVKKVTNKDESVEEYYLNLMRGNKHD